MNNPRDILTQHVQYSPKSCAASGMEMLLKLHSRQPASFRKFQDHYRNENIGFTRLADLTRYGIRAKAHELLIEEGISTIEREARSGKFPLVSLLGSQWHIWVAVIENNKLLFLSRDYENPEILQGENDFRIRQPLIDHRQGMINFVTYEISGKIP
jgi:hypothetical protein